MFTRAIDKSKMINSGTIWDLDVEFLKMGKPSSITEYSKVSPARQPQIFDDSAVTGARLEDYHHEGLRAAVGRNQGFGPRRHGGAEKKRSFRGTGAQSQHTLAVEKAPPVSYLMLFSPVCSGLSMGKPGAASGRNPISHHEDTKGTKKREGRKRSVTMIPPPCNQGRARIELSSQLSLRLRAFAC